MARWPTASAASASSGSPPIPRSRSSCSRRGQAADTVVLCDLDWNPQNDKQAVARVHRVGQEKEVRVVRLLADSAAERHMERCCLEKLEMERKIMGAGMF